MNNFTYAKSIKTHGCETPCMTIFFIDLFLIQRSMILFSISNSCIYSCLYFRTVDERFNFGSIRFEDFLLPGNYLLKYIWVILEMWWSGVCNRIFCSRKCQGWKCPGGKCPITTSDINHILNLYFLDIINF